MLAQRGKHREAHELAFEAMPQMPPDAPGRLAMELLTLFAHGRQFAIQRAVRGKQKWPGEWTTDVHTAYSLLLKHPLGTDRHVADHYDFLEFFRSPDAPVVLEQGIAKFPASALLHERLRSKLLREGGVERLLGEYARMLAQPDAPATLPWFAGYASLVRRRAAPPPPGHRRRQDVLRARAVAVRGLREGDRRRGRAPHEAMAHGGLARLALQSGDLDLTFSELQQVFGISPASASAVDGLSITAMQTAEMLRGKALEARTRTSCAGSTPR